MTKEEEKERGNLTVTFNYLKMAQDFNNAIYFLQKARDEVEIAAIKKGMMERERRHGDRRNNQSVQNNETRSALNHPE